jgi:hypothetical protein
MRSIKAIPAALVMTASLALGWPTDAHAYVRAVTDNGLPTWWRSPCITMRISLDSPPPAMTAADYLAAANIAGAQWGHDSLACSGLSIKMQKVSEPLETGLDGKNTIVAWQDSWSKHPVPDDPAQIIPHAPNAFAVTTVFKSKSTGEIVDADIEINAVKFVWTDLGNHPDLAAQGRADLQNTLTHELGHVIGLAHPCYTPNDGFPRLDDNTGTPELDCKDPALPLSTSEATMFPAVATSDIQRRSLAADDQQAACDIYPSATSTCHEAANSGCGVAPRPSEGLSQRRSTLVVLLSAWIAAMLIRRRSSLLASRRCPPRVVRRR